MTSETSRKPDRFCSWNGILKELARAASLEIPGFGEIILNESPPNKTSRNSPPPASSAKPRSTTSSSTTSTFSKSEDFTMPIPRISLPRPAVLRSPLLRTSTTTLRPLSTTSPALGAWSGRGPDEHAVNRTDEKDTQSKPAHQGMREKDEGDSQALGISEKGGKDNKKAEQDKQEAPTPVIGMNDERGGKGR
ncbi:hypothetical protein EPUS_02617 [Endocarpon pusillum Z07020]|uniref:Uncharacterized protein n=1 Tax=Endocarpon pusillum (strain Z07020 / HMAS-L-300199) TaxID=1263415 RepID=U1GXP7_ENDPU|nr:uncharacterized protein EPUS_02617 [Endocarpon pusillum Z07020]ERF76906.1 hypothetical protein EPUS_02617 [Endocarpon pusillum Z07020]